MKILLVMPNLSFSGEEFCEGSPVVAPAIGMMYVSSYLKSKGYDVTTLNLNHNKTSAVANIVTKNRFDVIATGGLYTDIKKVIDIFGIAKECSKGIQTILGGVIASAHPEFAMKAIRPDFLVIGEGEQTMCELVTGIDGSLDLQGLPGIAFIRNGEFIQTSPRAAIEDLDALPYPDYEGFEYGRYLDMPHFRECDNVSYLRENLRKGFIIGGRDCPAKCTFCFHVTKRKYRLRSIDNIIAEIKYLIDNYGVNDITMEDDLFSINKSRVYEFCRKIKPMGIPWWCSLRVPGVDEGILSAMKDAGCYLVGYGFESGSNKVLKSMKKGIRVKQIESVLPLTRKAGLTLQGNFIFGDPNETLETARESLRFAHRYKSYQINFGFIKPFPGTELYFSLLRKGAIKNLFEFWSNSAKDENGDFINMTSLNAIEFTLLKARVSLENAQKICHRVIKSVRISKNKYKLSIVCAICHKKAEELTVESPRLVACPHCYQRSWIDSVDLSGKRYLERQVTKIIRHGCVLAARVLLRWDSLGLMVTRGFLFARKGKIEGKLYRYLQNAIGRV